MMKKCCAVVVMVVFVCSVSSFALATTTFKLAHVYNPDHAWDQGANLAAQLVKEKSNGEIEIEVFPASQ